MSSSDPKEGTLEFKCPECGVKFEVSEKQAERETPPSEYRFVYEAR